MTRSSEVDLTEVPISALSEATRQWLESSLNPIKVIPTDETNLLRDWRGLAQCAGLKRDGLVQYQNPVAEVLKLWANDAIQSGKKPPSIKELQDILGKLDRWDVYDDTEKFMLDDAEQYMRSLQLRPVHQDTVSPLMNGCLTIDDVERLRQGLDPIKYDAFLLYANEDLHYAKMMIKKLQTDYKRNIVVKDRDLLGGGLEFQTIMKIIEERCSCIVVIISQKFLNSTEQRFFLDFAQMLSLENQHLKRIIPCVFEPCTLPAQIRYLCYLDYQKSLLFGNFWPRINQSIAASIDITQTSQRSDSQCIASINRCTITEVESSEFSPIANSSETEHTTIIRMSDRSTHFPGKPIDCAVEDKWSLDKSSAKMDTSRQLMKSDIKTERKAKSSFLSQITSSVRPKKKEKNCQTIDPKVTPKTSFLSQIASSVRSKKKNRKSNERVAIALEA